MLRVAILNSYLSGKVCAHKSSMFSLFIYFWWYWYTSCVFFFCWNTLFLNNVHVSFWVLSCRRAHSRLNPNQDIVEMFTLLESLLILCWSYWGTLVWLCTNKKWPMWKIAIYSIHVAKQLCLPSILKFVLNENGKMLARVISNFGTNF